MKTPKTRLGKLIDAIEDYSNSFSYYDEDLDETVVDGTEDEMYDVIMQDEEIHFLGTETVRKWIHMWFSNWEEYERTRIIMKRSGLI